MTSVARGAPLYGGRTWTKRSFMGRRELCDVGFAEAWIGHGPSSRAVVIFGSRKTLGHSSKARLAVTRIEVRT